MTRSHSISFVHAWQGVWYAVKTQPNFVIHLVLSALVLATGWWVSLSHGEWEIISLAITGGLVIELINTSIESVVDLATSQIHPLAKIAKDCASAAMLVYAVGAVSVGLLIFIPKLWPYS